MLRRVVWLKLTFQRNLLPPAITAIIRGIIAVMMETVSTSVTSYYKTQHPRKLHTHRRQDLESYHVKTYDLSLSL